MPAQRDSNDHRDDAPLRVVSHRLQRTSDAGAPSQHSNMEPVTPSQRGGARSERERLPQVVLVDRDADALRDIAVALRESFDFHVTISGHEALALLQSGTIDAIVVGQTLYSSTGMNVLAEAARRRPNVRRVLLASAAEATDLETKSGPAAPFQVLDRPCTPQKLLDVLETEPEDADAVPSESARPAEPDEKPSDTSEHRRATVTPNTSHDEYEHVILETPPELPRRVGRRSVAAQVAELPVVVYTDNADFYRAVLTALQDDHDVRLATQLENAVEMAELGVCPILITDRAGTQTELQRISIALRAAEANLVTIACGPPAEGLALRKLLNTPALHSFLPKPLSAPLVRLTVDAAKRHYLQSKLSGDGALEHKVGQTIATPSTRNASARPHYRPLDPFAPALDDDQRFEFRRWLPYLGIAAAVVLLAGGGYSLWTSRTQDAARTATLIEHDLEFARRAYDAGDYVVPENANALLFYRRALQRDPENAQALAGLDAVAERLVEKVERELTEDRVDAASESLAQLREADPAHKRIEFLDSQIRKSTTYRQAQRAAEQSAQLARAEAAKAAVANARLNERRNEDVGAPALISNASERSQAVGRWLATARQRIAQNRLVAPDNDSAEYYLRLAERADPNNSAVDQGLREIVARLITEAEGALTRQQLELSRRHLADAARLGADPKTIARLQGELTAAVDADVRGNFLRLALARTRDNAIFEPAQDSAKYYLSQLQRIDPRSNETQQALKAIALKLLDNANQATAQRQFNMATRLLEETRRLGFSGPELADSERRLESARNPPPPVRENVRSTPPKVVKTVAARFPEDAMAAGVSGWVDVAFKINAAGDVYDAVAIASNPPGPYRAKFERSALNAIGQYKFEPRPLTEEQTQSMVVRVQFKLEAPRN